MTSCIRAHETCVADRTHPTWAAGRRALRTSTVRSLTPRECERLQGFPDDYTLVPYRKGTMADGPRYKALGNSMAVPVMRWIGERIETVERLAGASLAA
jgi:DNA (cytosine-5)-methyltransferase 1